MSRPPNDQGFSLVEALVALGVFAMAGVAIVQLQAHALGAFARVEQRALADLVAQNRMTEVMASHPLPPLGRTQETAHFAGRDWRLSVIVARTPDARTRRISIEAGAPDAAPVALAHAFAPAAEDAP